METYLEVFEACKLKIESGLMGLKLLWKDVPLLSRCNSIIQSSLFTSDSQFLNCYLSYFLPAAFRNEDGIEIGISFSQKVAEENSSQVYSSRIIYDERGM